MTKSKRGAFMLRLNQSKKRLSINFIIFLLGCAVLLGLTYHGYGTTQARGTSALKLPSAAIKTATAPRPPSLETLVYNETKIVVPDGRAFAQLGAVEIDGNTLVIGASGDTVGANPSQGSAYVYVYDGTNWVFQQKLTANDGRTGDLFGYGVGINGNTIVIGATQADLGMTAASQGAAYVFVRNGNTWTEQAKIFAADASGGDEFGRTVSISGESIIVGARLSDRTSPNTQIDSGAAYVFVRNGTTWFQQAKLLASDGVGGDNFGWDVGISGDTAVVSAWFDAEGINTQQGSAYIFTRNAGGLWSQQTKILANDGLAGDWFGISAAIDGETVVIGARQDNHNPGTPGSFSGQGSAYIYTRSGMTWALQQKIIASDPVISGTFGESCDISGDMIIIGAFNVGGKGAAYLYQRSGTNWAFQQKFTASDGAANDFFGDFVAVGSYGAVASAYGDDIGMNVNQGSVYVYRMPSEALQFYPLAHPVRLLDTRPGQTGCDAPGATISGGSSRRQTAAGRTCDGLTIPANAKALTGNITTVESGGGFLTLYPSDITRPLVANSNFAANQVLNNVFTVGLGAVDGAFNIFVTTDTNVVVDITGYYAPPSGSGLYFHPLPHPVRLLDTRAGQPACFMPGALLTAGSTTTQLGTTTCDGVLIPAGAQALVGNATTVGPLANGFLTLFPADASRPLAASSNYQSGINMNAPFIVGLSPSGQFNIYTVAATNLVVDVLGYYSTQLNDTNGQGLLFNSLPTPVRLLDTRAGQTGCFTPGAQMTGGTAYLQPATGVCTGIPAAAKAFVGNATTVNVSANGFLTFWPSDASQPFVAASNYRSGTVFNRHFTVGLGADGAFKRFASSTTDLVIDLSGYFAP